MFLPPLFISLSLVPIVCFFSPESQFLVCHRGFFFHASASGDKNWAYRLCSFSKGPRFMTPMLKCPKVKFVTWYKNSFGPIFGYFSLDNMACCNSEDCWRSLYIFFCFADFVQIGSQAYWIISTRFFPNMVTFPKNEHSCGQNATKSKTSEWCYDFIYSLFGFSNNLISLPNSTIYHEQSLKFSHINPPSIRSLVLSSSYLFILVLLDEYVCCYTCFFCVLDSLNLNGWAYHGVLAQITVLVC